MNFTGFTQEDFDVFLIDGLDSRMEAIKEKIRPKLESLGQYFSPALTAMTGDEMFVHVAKHARRTVNPPKDTWVAFAGNPRGYKMLPHFQIGLWHTHLFIWFAVIYEAPQKPEIGARLAKKINQIHTDIPKDFVWSVDHTKPGIVKQGELSRDELLTFFNRLETVKKAEILCGYTLDSEEAIRLGGGGLTDKIDDVFRTVAPLYKISKGTI